MDQARPFRIAVASRFLRASSSEEVVGFASTSRLDGIVWSEGHVPAGDAGRATAARDETRGHGLEIVGYASAWHAGRGPFAEVVNVALLLGAPRIVLGATALAGGADRALALAELGRALDLARSKGIVVSLSYLPGALNATLGLVREAEHPSLRIAWRAAVDRGDERLPRPLRRLRFYVPDVRAAELTTAGGRRLPEADTRNRALGGSPERLRFAVFDPVPATGSAKPERGATVSPWPRNDRDRSLRAPEPPALLSPKKPEPR